MAVESSRGLGQGAAQVFDTSGLANQYAQQEDAKAKAKYTQQKDLEKKIAEVSGGLNDVFKEKIFSTRDREAIQGLYDDALKKMDGKWHLAADPRTPESREWNKLKQDVYMATAQSYETKQLLDPILKDMGENQFKYTEDTKKYITDVMSNPLTVFDPTKVKRVNTFDIDKNFNEGLGVYREGVKLANTKDSYYDANGVFVNQKTTKSTEEDENRYMESWIKSLQANPEAVDRINQEYGDEVAELQAQGQDVDVWDVLWAKKKPELKIDVKDVSASKSGDGAEEPFNPNNIVEDFDLSTGEKGFVSLDFGGVLGKVKSSETLGSTKTRMYQTKAITTTHPLSTNVIDITTGEKLNKSGTYNLKMGSPIFYNNDVYVPALTDSNESVLIPLSEVKEVFEAKGYDTAKIDSELRQTKGTTTTKTTVHSATRDEWKKAGWSDAQIEAGVKSGKIKVK